MKTKKRNYVKKKFKKQKRRKKFKLLMTEVSVLRSCVNNGGSVLWKFPPQLNFRHALSTYGPRRTFSLFPEKCVIIHCVLFLEKMFHIVLLLHKNN